MTGRHCFLTRQEDGGQVLVWPERVRRSSPVARRSVLVARGKKLIGGLAN